MSNRRRSGAQRSLVSRRPEAKPWQATSSRGDERDYAGGQPGVGRHGRVDANRRTTTSLIPRPGWNGVARCGHRSGLPKQRRCLDRRRRSASETARSTATSASFTWVEISQGSVASRTGRQTRPGEPTLRKGISRQCFLQPGREVSKNRMKPSGCREGVFPELHTPHISTTFTNRNQFVTWANCSPVPVVLNCISSPIQTECRN